MSTIAYRNGILAADTQVTHNDTIVFGMNKLYQLKCGSWFGFTGRGDQLHVWQEWVEAGMPPTAVELDVSILLVRRKQLWLFGGCLPPMRVKEPYHAVGSGAVFALAAMDAGADAVQAVRIACKRDIYSGGKVRSVKV